MGVILKTIIVHRNSHFLYPNWLTKLSRFPDLTRFKAFPGILGTFRTFHEKSQNWSFESNSGHFKNLTFGPTTFEL